MKQLGYFYDLHATLFRTQHGELEINDNCKTRSMQLHKYHILCK